MAAVEGLEKEITNKAKRTKTGPMVIISDDELSTEDDVVVLKSAKGPQSTQNPSTDPAEIIFTGHDKRKKTKRKRGGSNTSTTDFFYHFDIDSLLATATEVCCDSAQSTDRMDTTDSDYQLALRLQQELNPTIKSDEQYARILQEQEDVIFCSLSRRPEVEITSVSSKMTSTSSVVLPNMPSTSSAVLPTTSSNIPLPSSSRVMLPFTCTSSAVLPSTSTSVTSYTSIPRPSTHSKSTKATALINSYTNRATSNIEKLATSSLRKGKQSKSKQRGRTKVSRVKPTSLPPNTEGRTTIGNHVKSSLSILSYAHLGSESPSIQFITSSSSTFAFSSQDLPSWWSPCILCSSTSLLKKLYHLIEIPLTDNEARVIVFPLECTGYRVIKLERIQCPNLWRRYIAEVKLLVQSREESFQLNEQILYHCSRAEKSIICAEGLDVRLSHNGCFGRGIYFSDNPSKCNGYGTANGANKLMYACKVILGSTKVYKKGQGDNTLTREPPKLHPTGSYYDSVKGFMSVGDEYIIYNNYRCVPLYVITYVL